MAATTQFGVLFGICCLLFVSAAHGRHLKEDQTLVVKHKEMNHAKIGKEYFSSSNVLGQAPSRINRWEVHTITGRNFGSKASLSVWDMQLHKPDQVTTVGLWVAGFPNGSPDNGNIIQAGWHVWPQRYGGDQRPRFFVSWTTDSYKTTGCYNLDCPGFVLNDNLLRPGALVLPTSVVNGDRYYLTVAIVKNGTAGDWSLRIGKGDASLILGYWPKTLFTTLSEAGTQFSWGGVASSPSNEGFPPLGSGEFARAKERAADIRNIELFREDGSSFIPGVKTFADDSVRDEDICYGITPVENSGGAGDIFYYGGPGGCTAT